MQKVALPACQRQSACSGLIHSSRLAWLCQPAQIEHTLLLLFYLTTWRKATQQLFATDRQGLQQVLVLILEQATKTDIVQAVAYLDGTSRFPGDLQLESVAENAARGVLIHLRSLTDPDTWPPSPDFQGDQIYQHYIRPFYKRITGLDCQFVADALGLLRLEEIRAYIQEQLQRLIETARVTRQPVPTVELMHLCISPIDLLHIRDHRICFFTSYEAWEDLEARDLRKLNPEGYSEIVFQYTSSAAEYVFHLPFTYALNRVSRLQVSNLRQTSEHSQERAMLQGREISETEGLAHPVRDILQDLGVDIARACPHNLQQKDINPVHPALRDLIWPTCNLESEDQENELRENEVSV